MYAIVKTGGKQYRVSEGDTLVVEKLEGAPETSIDLETVLMVSTDDGLKFGEPLVEGAKVVATIVEQGRGKKINGYTFKPKKNVHRRYGHRQYQTTLHIDRIEA